MILITSRVIQVMQELAHVRYVYDGKCENIKNYPVTLPHGGLDCSGFMRILVHHASMGVDIGDGSVNQREYFTKHGYEREFNTSSAIDGQYRMNIYEPIHGIGHIWLTKNGYTYECYGGNGVGNRRYNSLTQEGRLCDIATYTFLIPTRMI